MQLQNAIRVNQRGFLRNSQKRFILVENATGSLDFSVVLTKDVDEITVFTGEMTKAIENGRCYYVGDFSALTDEGDYHILAGGVSSRQFVIYDNAYDICNRLLLEYFTYQRCGHALGWNGKCHTDDGYIKETGEHVDLSGGYHQSCDLRKSPGGVSIGVSSMLRFAVKDKSEWGKILVSDEVKWACDYFTKTIQPNGAMYNTLNAPFGWGSRVFYKSPAPSSAEWNTVSLLALGYSYFKNSDTPLAKKYLDASLRAWDFMLSSERPSEQYKHPDPYPRGMDPDFFYEQCKKDSCADLAYQITAACDLYFATGEARFLKHTEKCTPRLLEYLLDGDLAHILVRDDNKAKTVCASCSYTWLSGGLLALIDAYTLLGDKYGLLDKIKRALDATVKYADKSVWHSLQNIYSDGDLDIVDGHDGKTRRACVGELVKIGSYVADGKEINCYYPKNAPFEPTFSTYLGIFLARGAKIVGDKKYMGYAQSIADLLLGGNDLDSSHIRGIGFNHAPHKSYGQFFPSTPFIPGAVGVGYSTIDTYTSSSEFDMPCVGLSMRLFSELE